jgi:TolA-binding protein
MRLIAAVLAVAAAVACAPVARAQETDEQIKRRILDRVKERLAEEKKLILERMSKVIDEELSGGPKKEPAAPKTTDKRIRDLERKLQALDDQRDDLMRDIRDIKRETEDAKIIADAKKSPIESGQEGAEEFQDAFKAHNDATKDLESDKAKAAKGFERSIAGFKRIYYALKDNDDAKQLTLPSAYNVACGYALVGKNTEAIDWLEIAIRHGYSDYDHMRKDTDLDGLRKERRFLRLLADR